MACKLCKYVTSAVDPGFAAFRIPAPDPGYVMNKIQIRIKYPVFLGPYPLDP